MKTFLSLLFVLVLITTVVSLDAHRLDASVVFSALAVATLFAFALNDCPWRRRPPMAARHIKSRPMPSAAWAGRKVCVLCSGAASL